MKWAVALVWALATVSVSAADRPRPTKIEVFTDREAPVATQGFGNVDVYRLDTPARLESALSAGLPADPKRAKRIAWRRVRQAASAQAAPLQHAYEGLVKARAYRLDRLPAIVFDGGRAVVYGVADLEVALSPYREWRQTQDGEPP
jgi:integrating conjugative element protein (TIGR03757 family)